MDFSEKTGLFIYNAISIAFFLIFLSYRREFYYTLIEVYKNWSTESYVRTKGGQTNERQN